MTKANMTYQHHGTSMNLKMNWWDSLWWPWLKNRGYARNHNYRHSIVVGLFLGIEYLLAYGAFQYFPFHIFGCIFGVGCFLLMIGMGLSDVNKAPYVPLYFIVAGGAYVLAIDYHLPHLPITFFHYHLERSVALILIAAGVLGYIRLGWNALMWRYHDAMVARYSRR